MSLRLTLLCLACLCEPVIAATYTVNYSGVVQATNGSSMPPLGGAIDGTIILDDDPLVYAPATGAPQGPNYFAYQLSGPPYGSSIVLPSSTFSAPIVSVEVFDNDLSLLGVSESGDAIALSAKIDGLSYTLLLRGSASSFSGTAVPSPALLSSFWDSARLFAKDSTLQSFNANVASLAVSPVPEPQVFSLFALGLGCLALRRMASDT